MTTTIRLLSLKPRQDRGDYVSRVYPRCSNISLANTTRTSTGNYTLDKGAGYIANLVNEATYGRRERVQTFQIDTPTNAITQSAQQQMAADALFDRALEWLRQHDTIPVFYTARVVGQDALIAAGTTIHIVTTTTVNGEAVYVIDDDFNITEARNYLNDAGMLEAELEITSIERGAVTDAKVVATAVVSAERATRETLSVVNKIAVTNINIEGKARIVGGTIDGVDIGLVEPGDAAFTTILNEGRTWLAGYTVLGGELVLVKAQGILAGELSAAAETLDFGQTMTPNDFVILRSMYQNPYEYIKVGSQVSGTIYNITRAQGGSTAQTWPANSVWLLLGHAGDGRISLRTDSAPRISVLAQGATANSATTQALLGDLNGYYGYGSSTPGLGLGEYASGKANVTVDPTNGLRLRLYDTDYIQLTNDGNALIAGKLQLKGANSALAIGSTPPTSASAGTGLWLDRTGLYGLNANALQVKIDAATGALMAGAGAIRLDSEGLRAYAGETLQFKVDAATGALIAGGGNVKLDSSGLVLACDMTPATTDTYDLGSLNKWWKSLYASTIKSTVFSQNVQQVLGGSFLIPHQAGNLPAVASGDTQIDFGHAMTVDDHLVIKSLDTSGVPRTEYIKIGSLVSGTTYNVTRDEADANDPDPAWPDGTPYAVLGTTGDGSLTLDASTTPRLSIFSQGANYNSQTEVVRLGDINGLGNIDTTTWGLYAGATDKAYLTVDPTNGLKVASKSDSIVLDVNGINVKLGEALSPELAITFKDANNNTVADLWCQTSSYWDFLMLEMARTSAVPNWIMINADAAESKGAVVQLEANVTNSTTNAILYVSNEPGGLAGPGKGLIFKIGGNLAFKVDDSLNTIIYGSLQSYKNSTAYTGYIYVPLSTPLTSTSWAGNSFSNTSATKIDLSSVFGVPDNIKAVCIRIQARDSASWGTNNLYVGFGPDGSNWHVTCRVFGGDVISDFWGICPCDSAGDIYYTVAASGTNTLDVWLRIMGYFI